MPYKDRDKRYLKGLCSYCPNKVASGYKRCHECLDKAKKGGTENKRKSRLKRKKAGLCVECGIKLHHIMDRDKTSCLNCLEHKSYMERLHRR